MVELAKGFKLLELGIMQAGSMKALMGGYRYLQWRRFNYLGLRDGGVEGGGLCEGLYSRDH